MLILHFTSTIFFALVSCRSSETLGPNKDSTQDVNAHLIPNQLYGFDDLSGRTWHTILIASNFPSTHWFKPSKYGINNQIKLVVFVDPNPKGNGLIEYICHLNKASVHTGLYAVIASKVIKFEINERVSYYFPKIPK